MPTTDEIQPSGLGIDYDLEVLERRQAAEERRLDKLNDAKIRLLKDEAYEKGQRRRRLVSNIKKTLVVFLIVGVLTAAVFGCMKWYDASYEKNAKKWLAWMSQCDQAGGKPVGERHDLICAFPQSELPYGQGGSIERWDKKYGPVWRESCSVAGGRPAGIEEYMICVFPSGAQLPYGKFGTAA